MIITIDGPTASGKSTVGRLIAKRLGFYYVNSGLFYRAVAYLLKTHKSYSQAQLAHPQVDDVRDCLNPKRFHYVYTADLKERISYDGKDITSFLGDDEISQAASILSTNQLARSEINAFLRKLAQDFDLVVDGRDAGTVIFPQADLKFFLTARLNERMRRWILGQARLGHTYSRAQAMEMIFERDKRDRERAIAPLVIPEDAFIIDNSDLTQLQTVQYMLSIVKRQSC